jgi:Cu(I)/Ag(I) efflux system protein CusF
MKRPLVSLFVVSSLGLSTLGVAAEHDHGAILEQAKDTMHMQARTEAASIVGLVKKVDKAAGKVTVSHGPLPNGMPPMTMVFRLQEAGWIDQIKEGQTIRYTAEHLNGAMTIVRFEPAK